MQKRNRTRHKQTTLTTTTTTKTKVHRRCAYDMTLPKRQRSTPQYNENDLKWITFFILRRTYFASVSECG